MGKTKCLLVFSLCFLIVLPGCTSKLRFDQGLLNRLKNRGPVALSSDNPYLAANLFLNKEAEKHPELEGFLAHKGIPEIMEVEQALFSPVFLKFYYTQDKEFFNLEETPNTWLIDGPHRIPPEKMEEVATVIGDVTGQPLLDLIPDEEADPQDTEPEFFPAETANSAGDTDKSWSGPGARPLSIKKDKDPFLARLEKQENPQIQARRENFKSVSKSPYYSSTQLYLTEKSDSVQQGYLPPVKTRDTAELTPNGDLVHYITYPGETLYMISRWYTRDQDNSGKLARINSIANPDKLSIGDVIVIPSYLVKNKNRLTEKAVEALQIIATEEGGGG